MNDRTREEYFKWLATMSPTDRRRVAEMGLSRLQVLMRLNAGDRKNTIIAEAAGISRQNVAACRTRLFQAGFIHPDGSATPKGILALTDIFQ